MYNLKCQFQAVVCIIFFGCLSIKLAVRTADTLAVVITLPFETGIQYFRFDGFNQPPADVAFFPDYPKAITPDIIKCLLVVDTIVRDHEISSVGSTNNFKSNLVQWMTLSV